MSHLDPLITFPGVYLVREMICGLYFAPSAVLDTGECNFEKNNSGLHFDVHHKILQFQVKLVMDLLVINGKTVAD